MTNVPDPWQNAGRPVPVGPAFGELLSSLREVQDLFCSVNAPEEVLQAALGELRKAADELRAWEADEWDVPAGKHTELPGRGHPLLPPFVIEEQDDVSVVARVRMGRFYLGGNGAAHGGVLPLLFDDILGRLSNAGNRARARTAYLHVDYRKVTPIGPELIIEATVDREEGRKRFVSGRLRHGDAVVAEATGLFVVLREGQP